MRMKDSAICSSPMQPFTGADHSDTDIDDLLGELPLEVVHHMFGFLDPVTLGKAACVCSTWHQIVTQDDSIWQGCCQQLAAGGSTLTNKLQQPLPEGLTYHQLFTSTVTSKLYLCCACLHCNPQ